MPKSRSRLITMLIAMALGCSMGLLAAAASPAPNTGWYTEGDFVPTVRVRITVANPLAVARRDAPVVITRAEFPEISFPDYSIFVVDPALPPQPDPTKAEAKRVGSGVTFKETNGHLIPYQLDDLDKDGRWDELFFMSDFRPSEVKSFYVYFGAQDRGLFEHETHAEIGSYGRRFVPWWESKTMGWKLWYPTDVDLYGKRRPMLVADHEDTLNISGYTAASVYGNDIMTVEDTFGAGGICLFEDPSRPTSPSRPRFSPTEGRGQLEDTRYAFDVVANGPLRSIIGAHTMGWRTGRGAYGLEQLYSSYKNKSYSTVRVRFTRFDAPGSGVRLGCGFRKLPNEAEFVHEGGVLMSLSRDVDVFDPDVQKEFATRLLVKFLGTALVVKDKYAPEYRFTTEHAGNHLLALPPVQLVESAETPEEAQAPPAYRALLKRAPRPKAEDLAFEYLIAAGWSEGSVNRTPDEFKKYIRDAAAEFNHPIECRETRREDKNGQPDAAETGAAGQAATAGQSGASVKVGLGDEIITPPAGVPMAGYARTGVSTGVHDDLHARSLVIEGADGTPAVLMTLGIINLDGEYADAIRAAVQAETGIPEQNVLISCTHTHSGPDVNRSGDAYIKFLVDRAAKSAITAWKGRVPGRIGTGATIVTELGRNDRRLEYGGLHVDPEVGLIKIEDAKGKLLGVAFNYGCHPSTLNLRNLEFTEDWPYYAIRRIKRALGEDVWAAFFQSAQGDSKVGYTAELSAVGAEMPIRNFWYADVKGKQMAEAVAAAIPGIATSANPDVRVVSAPLELPLRESYPMTAKAADAWLAAAKRNLSKAEARTDIGPRALDKYKVDIFLANLSAQCAHWVEANPKPAPLRTRLFAARLGDAAFVTFPCEVFTEIGLEVKQASPVAKTFVLGVAGGLNGYIPTAAEYKEGGYAVVQTHYSPRCEEVLAAAALALIKKLD